MINQDQNINPAVVAFISNSQPSQMAIPQPGNPYASAHLVVTDIECGAEGALFSLLNGSKFSLSYENMVTGLQVNALNNLVLLSYQVMPVGGGFSAPHVQSSMQLAVENRVVALACSPMTAALIERLRNAVSGKSQPDTCVSHVDFETPLMMRGIAQDNFNAHLVIYGYTLHANRTLELVVSAGTNDGDSTTSHVRPAVEWRPEMAKWTEVSVPTQEHRVLLSMIKVHTSAPQGNPNDLQPRNTAGDYHGRGTSPTMAMDETNAYDVEDMSLIVHGNDNQTPVTRPVKRYLLSEDQTRVTFYTEGPWPDVECELVRLGMRRKTAGQHLVVEVMKKPVSKDRRYTLRRRLTSAQCTPLEIALAALSQDNA